MGSTMHVVCECVRLTGRRGNCDIEQPVRNGTFRRRDVGRIFGTVYKAHDWALPTCTRYRAMLVVVQLS